MNYSLYEMNNHFVIMRAFLAVKASFVLQKRKEQIFDKNLSWALKFIFGTKASKSFSIKLIELFAF